MKKTLWRALLLLLSGLAIGWVAGILGGGPGRGLSAISVHTGMTVEQVRALSSLVTARVEVADVQESRLAGHTGGLKTALLVKGDFLLGTDLSQARFESVDDAARTAVLVLPAPRATSPRLDHERTRLFALSSTGLWLVTPDGHDASATLLNQAYRDAQRFVSEAAESPALQAQARRQAEQLLGAFFKATGWQVSVRWGP